MNYTFNLGEVNIPVGKKKSFVAKDVKIEVTDLNILDVAKALKEMPAILREIKAIFDEDSDCLCDLIGQSEAVAETSAIASEDKVNPLQLRVGDSVHVVWTHRDTASRELIVAIGYDFFEFKEREGSRRVYNDHIEDIRVVQTADLLERINNVKAGDDVTIYTLDRHTIAGIVQYVTKDLITFSDADQDVVLKHEIYEMSVRDNAKIQQHAVTDRFDVE